MKLDSMQKDQKQVQKQQKGKFLIPNYSKIVVYINMVNIRLKNVQLHLQERREKFNYENNELEIEYEKKM